MYYLLLPTLEKRQDFIRYLKSKSIQAVFHYLPLNTSMMGMKFGGKAGDCPVTENLSDRLVRLPFHRGLTDEDLSQIVDEVSQFKV